MNGTFIRYSSYYVFCPENLVIKLDRSETYNLFLWDSGFEKREGVVFRSSRWPKMITYAFSNAILYSKRTYRWVTIPMGISHPFQPASTSQCIKRCIKIYIVSFKRTKFTLKSCTQKVSIQTLFYDTPTWMGAAPPSQCRSILKLLLCDRNTDSNHSEHWNIYELNNPYHGRVQDLVQPSESANTSFLFLSYSNLFSMSMCLRLSHD